MTKPTDEKSAEAEDGEAARSPDEAGRERREHPAESLVLRYLESRSHEELVALVAELASSDKALRAKLGVRARLAPLDDEGLFAHVRRLIGGDVDDEEARADDVCEALDRLYLNGHDEPLLELLREVIVADHPRTEVFATQLAGMLMEAFEWTAERRLLWYTETRLASNRRYSWSYLTFGDDEEDDLEDDDDVDDVDDDADDDADGDPVVEKFSAETWGAIADELLRRFEHHPPVRGDDLAAEITDALWRAGRQDEALEFQLRTLATTGAWEHALSCLIYAEPSPRLADQGRRLLSLLEATPDAPADARARLTARLKEIQRKLTKLQLVR